MNRIIIVLIAGLIFLSAGLNAQFKVKDKSGKEPDWTSGLEKNYIIGIGNGSSLEAARDQAILDVKSQIVVSVADYISSNTEFYTKEITADKFSELYQSYTNQIESQSGKRDYLQGISASKADDYYWEKLYNRKAKETKYKYFVKYPFTNYDLNALVRDFNEKDQMLTDEMTSTLQMLETYTSVEELQECKRLLARLASIFIDERKSKCQTGMDRCDALLASVYIADAGSELGMLRYSLRIGQKTITYGKKPVVRSNCAQLGNVVIGELINTISYAYNECYDEPGNHIKVYYSFSNQRPEKMFYFNVAEEKAELVIVGNIRITGGSKDENMVAGAECIIPLKSKYDSPVSVNSIVLEWENQGIIVDVKLNEVLKGTGQHDVRFTIPNELPADKVSTIENPGSTVNGYLSYKSMKTGKTEKIRIYRHDYSTGW